MLSKDLPKSKILVVSLTNIGDVILTLPVVDVLKRDFPQAEISLSVGPKARSLFNQNPNLANVYIYDKRQSPLKTIRWMFELRRKKFDLVVDLRNSAIPFLIAPKARTPAAKIKADEMHMKHKHLERLRTVHQFDTASDTRYAIHVPDEDKDYIDQHLKKEVGDRKYVVIAPGAAYHKKRWDVDKYASLADRLVKEHHLGIVFAGDRADRDVVMQIEKKMNSATVNMAGMTTLIQLAELIQRAELVISNDSAPMHLASYLDRPVLGLFGPSDVDKYGPWSTQSYYCQAKEFNDDQEPDISTITVEEVFNAIRCSDGHVTFSR